MHTRIFTFQPATPRTIFYKMANVCSVFQIQNIFAVLGIRMIFFGFGFGSWFTDQFGFGSFRLRIRIRMRSDSDLSEN